MPRSRIEFSVLVVTGVAVAMSVVGCTGNVSGEGAQPAVPTFTSSGSPTVSPSAPPSPAPPASTEQPPPEPAASGECRAGELELSIGRGDAAAGTVFRPLRFTNIGGRSCTMQGFPGVSYVAGEDGRQVGPAAAREGTKGPAAGLAPGETAFATVAFVQVRNFDPAVCRPVAVRGLRVYPPHDTAAMFLPLEGTGCAGTPPDPQLRVKSVHKGQGGS